MEHCWSAAAYLSRISTNPMSNTRYYTSIGRHVLASKVANLSSNSFDQPAIQITVLLIAVLIRSALTPLALWATSSYKIMISKIMIVCICQQQQQNLRTLNFPIDLSVTLKSIAQTEYVIWKLKTWIYTQHKTTNI